MSWARLDDGFHDHPKVDGLSLAAVGLFTLCLTWAHRHRRTAAIPGHIPASRVRKLAGTRATSLTKELTTPLPGKTFGLWETVDDGYVIHDFAEYLPKERDPDELAAAGRRGGLKRAATAKQIASNDQADSQDDGKQTASKDEANREANSSSRASAPAFPSRPDPTRSSNYRSEGGERSSVGAQTVPPPQTPFCEKHPDGTDEPCRACGDARRRYDQAVDTEETRASEQAAAAAHARAECGRCDDDGWILHPETSAPVARCDHQPIGAHA